jgi:glucose/arabinose dehydrogenase
MTHRTPSLLALALLPAAALAQQDNRPEHEFFQVREGYRVSVAASLPDARFLEFDDKGTLYVSRPDRGDIIAMRDKDADGVFEDRAEFVTGHTSVHAMSFHDGWLWFATSGSIHKARDTGDDLKADEIVDVVPVGKLPRKGTHWWRSLLVTGDGFYTSIGDSENISDQRKTDRQKIWKFSLDGSTKTLVASGIRNTEKLRFRPGTTELWGFDHGSDHFGASIGPGSTGATDLNPPDELNLYVQDGFYGHPFVAGNRVPRPEYATHEEIASLCDQTVPPAWNIGAHWATNGFTFLDPEVNARTGAFPADHGGDIFFAAHGSWNATRRVGYCIGRVLFDNGKPYGMLKIVSTLEEANQVVWARPVDCAQAPDGSIVFSSDQPGRIYRLQHIRRPE